MPKGIVIIGLWVDCYRHFKRIILYYANLGEMPEWSNGPVSKSGVCHRTEGSNPSLSLKQIRNPLWVPYLFQEKKQWMRTLAEGSTNSPRAKRTQASLGLRPPAVTRRARRETKWTSCPIPLSPRERGSLLDSEMVARSLKDAGCHSPRTVDERTKRSEFGVPSLSLLERGALSLCAKRKKIMKIRFFFAYCGLFPKIW